jgi:exosortase/archaeosortase family protein
MLKQLLEKQKGIPPYFKRFLLLAGALFISWSLLYNLLLKPAGIPDRQLTQVVVEGTRLSLQPFFDQVFIKDTSIYIDGTEAVNIAPQCNGLELIVLYLGFLICIPASGARKLKFAAFGILLITLLNVLRCSLLAWLYMTNFDIAEFAHHFAFKLVIYSVVFCLWVLFIRKPAKLAKEA